MSNNPTWEDITNIREELFQTYLQYWVDNEVFSLNWWVLLTLLFAIPIIWWVLADKRRIFELLAYGLLVSALATFFDSLFMSMVLFGHKTRLIPILPPLLPYLTMIPFLYMLIYQWFTTLKSLTISTIFLALILAYVAEPILVWMDIYNLQKWTHTYSFAVYLTLGILSKLVMMFLVKEKSKVVERRDKK
ncbi:CBO0543 family protein [Alkalibacillus aidingensis]|uniref:CBO0543 family protein n=1 Tax=Alkalibacillus aidingensis TaxID=2747607 RepID=UPI0016614ABA|nr:CBO0543 family protein [Alkalibacillus aidingensis]